MKLSVTSVMELKNTLVEKQQDAYSALSNSRATIQLNESDPAKPVDITNYENENTAHAIEVYDQISQKLLALEAVLNKFNASVGMYALVKRGKNLETMIDILNSKRRQAVDKRYTQRVSMSGGPEAIVHQVVDVPKDWFDCTLARYTKELREIREIIARHNTTEIEIPDESIVD